MKRLNLVWWFVCGLLVSVSVGAQAPELVLSPAHQARWEHIASELRCMVCQNESLSSSNADLAVDLRREVKTLIVADRNDDEIRAFLVGRYGDFVLYKPEIKPVTWLLWFGPFVLLGVALLAAWRLMRRRNVSTEALSDMERERVRQWMES